MRFTEEHEQFRKAVRQVVDNDINPHVEQWEAAGIFPAHQVFSQFAAIGALGLEYDPQYGGQGADHSYTLVFGEELGRINCAGVPLGIAVQVGMATPSLAKFGTHEQKKQYLEPAMRGEMVASIAVSEPDAGSDVAGIRTKAVRDGDDWVITGRKMWITNGTQADWLCLLARTSDEGGYGGMSQIIVPTRPRDSVSGARSRRWATEAPTLPNSCSMVCAYQLPTPSVRWAAGSSSRWRSSRTSA